MSYIGETRRTAFEAFGAATVGILLAGALRVWNVMKAIARRRVIADLGEFDDRMLRDIGLTRSDVMDAASGPVWQDPTSLLVVRSVERRAARRLAARERSAAQRSADLSPCQG